MVSTSLAQLKSREKYFKTLEVTFITICMNTKNREEQKTPPAVKKPHVMIFPERHLSQLRQHNCVTKTSKRERKEKKMNSIKSIHFWK